jgi:hypothetical protein
MRSKYWSVEIHRVGTQQQSKFCKSKDQKLILFFCRGGCLGFSNHVFFSQNILRMWLSSSDSHLGHHLQNIINFRIQYVFCSYTVLHK